MHEHGSDIPTNVVVTSCGGAGRIARMNSLMLIVSLAVLPLLSVSAAKPGAYYDATDKEEVKTAADFAVKEQENRDGAPLQLEQVLEAKKQIVAGTNYQLTLMVNERRREKRVVAKAFRRLDRHYELKSWSEENNNEK
jgi:Cystatin domain